MTQLVAAGYLFLWGIAILLCWVSLLRLANLLHILAAAKGYIRAPAHVMAPMVKRSEFGFTLIALACGVSALVAFASSATQSLNLPGWTMGVILTPGLQILRIFCGSCVLLFFLTRVAEHPRYKLAWAACWAVFSLAVVNLA